MKRLIICLLLGSLFLCCSSNKSPVGPSGNADFSIYLLKDPSILITQVIDTGIDDLELADRPWLSAKDIEYYDYSTHCIHLKQSKNIFFPQDFFKEFYNRPFVVCANSQRCYMGRFSSMISSLASVHPCIYDNVFNQDPIDVIQISREIDNGQDLRENFLVEQALKKLGLYR